MLRPARAAAVAACALPLASCGGGDGGGLPDACPADPEVVLSSLRDAPGRVRVEGLRLSECLSEESDAGDVQRVGTAYVEAAATLAAQARRRPGGAAALRLGYLVAAVRQGASATGVHTELLRRLEQELALVDTSSAAFRRGRRAGRRSG